MSVVILVPVLHRPHRVRPLLESIEAATPQPHRVLFIASPDDDAEQQAVVDADGELLVLDRQPGPGDYARKINAGYRATAEPLMLLGADDLHFHADWLERAAERLAPGVGVIGTNDLGNQSVIDGNHATHPLVVRRYIDQLGTVDRPGEVLHEGYPHEYVDNEFVETAKARNAWVMASDSIVEHMHPHWGKAPTDALYDDHPQRMRAGRRLYHRRLPRISAEARRQRRFVGDTSATSTVTVITASLPSRAALLTEALASVSAQTVPCAHLVGVDASRGVAEVRTALVTAANTEWVGFLDDDDLIDADHIATLLANAGDADVIIPHCRFDGPELPARFCNRTFSNADLRAHGVFPITVLARRQAVLDAGGFRAEDQWEDWSLWNRMADRDARFVVVPKVTWTYRTSTSDRRTTRLQATG